MIIWKQKMEVRSFRCWEKMLELIGMLLDINMSQMNGFDVLKWMKPKSSVLRKLL